MFRDREIHPRTAQGVRRGKGRGDEPDLPDPGGLSGTARVAHPLEEGGQQCIFITPKTLGIAKKRNLTRRHAGKPIRGGAACQQEKEKIHKHPSRPETVGPQGRIQERPRARHSTFFFSFSGNSGIEFRFYNTTHTRRRGTGMAGTPPGVWESPWAFSIHNVVTENRKRSAGIRRHGNGSSTPTASAHSSLHRNGISRRESPGSAFA